MTQLPQPKKRKSQESKPLFNKPVSSVTNTFFIKTHVTEVISVKQVAFSSTFQKVEEWHDFRGSLERDPDLCKLIDRCEKPLTPLKYAKLLYDFGNAYHPDDWEYISGCFMSSLKSNDDFQDFYTKLKHMYEEICECD